MTGKIFVGGEFRKIESDMVVIWLIRLGKTLLFSAIFLGLCFGFLEGSSQGREGWERFLYAFTWALSLAILGLAAALFGILFGLLYGLPSEKEQQARNGGKDLGNTRLAEISDWLTKIIVGIGIVQAKDIWSIFENFVISMVGSPGSFSGSVIAIVLAFLFDGIGIGYLGTRFFVNSWESELQRQARLGAQAKITTSGDVAEGTVTDAARVIATEKTKNDLVSPEDFVAWVKGKFASRQFGDAASVIIDALSKHPDSEIVLQTARKIADVKKNKNVMRALPENSLQPSNRVEAEEFLNWMVKTLYSDRQNELDAMVRAATDYKSNPHLMNRSSFWAYLACGLGQQAAANPAQTAILAPTALAYVAQAVDLDKDWRETLRENWKGNNPNEDDLKSFRNDPGFKSYFG